jgi:hypothetical protein
MSIHSSKKIRSASDVALKVVPCGSDTQRGGRMKEGRRKEEEGKKRRKERGPLAETGWRKTSKGVHLRGEERKAKEEIQCRGARRNTGTGRLTLL